MRLASPACVRLVCTFALLFPGAAARLAIAAEPAPVTLPDGVSAVWDLARATHEATATQERVCLNGLWRWQPAQPQSQDPPVANWGFFKVPGSWPGITDYMLKD